MKLNRTGTQLNASELAKINENWVEIESEYTGVVDTVSDAAFDKVIDASKLTWGEPVATKADLPTSASEGHTRMARDTGKVYRYDGVDWKEIQQIDATPVNEVDARLSAKIDGNYSDVTSQLADEANARIEVDDKAFYSGIKLNRRNRAIMTIVDDDGYPQVHSMLKPLTEQENVPITSAVVTGRVGVASYSMDLQQIKECQDVGMEIQSHTVNHLNLSTLTYEEQEYEISQSKKWLQENGFNADALIYPFGGVNEDTYELTNLYYSAGIYIDGGTGLLNKTPIRSEKLERVYYNLLNPTNESDKNRVEYCKTKIDEAIATDSWMILGLHCFYDGFDPEGLREVIQYAKQQGIEIVTLKKGLELYSNLIELPDFEIDAKGSLHSYKLGRMQRLPNMPNSTDSISVYPQDAFSYRHYNNSQATSSGMPESKGGTLVTLRGASDTYAFQRYFLIRSNVVYERFWDDTTSSWSQWNNTVIPKTVSQIDTDIVDIAKNSHSYASTPSTDKPNYGNGGQNGYVITSVLSEDYKGFIFQNYVEGDTYVGTLYGGVWSGWKMLQPVISGDTSTRPSTNEVGCQFFDSTLGKPIWWKGNGWVDATGASV